VQPGDALGACPPMAEEKNLGAKFTGESCKVTPQAESAPPK